MPDPASPREDKSLAETDPIQVTPAEMAQASTDRLAMTEDFTAAAGTAEGAATNAFVADRYRLVRMHARGGLGQVSVAIDEQFGRPIALKQIQAKWLPIDDVRRRFEREAEITGKLEHPGIVPVYSRGATTEGEPFYAMRFIAGESLDEAIKPYHSGGRDRFQLRKLLRRFIDVCNTLQYAHDQGVIHRDLKPQNIMLGPYGETLVVDWGLAKVASQLSTTGNGEQGPVWQSQDGDVLGTPLYMSPEQSQAADAVGPPADVYSLGVTLYQLLTGTTPLAGLSRNELFAKLKQGKLPRPRERDSSLPRSLEAICLRALALEPTNRYASAAALAEDIERWLADEPVAAHREGIGERTTRLARRHRSWVTAGGIALGLVAVAAITATVLVDQSRRQALALAQSNAKLAQRESAAKEKAQQAERDRRRQFAQAQFDAGRFALERGKWRHSIELLKSALADECDDTVAAKLLMARAHYRLGQLEPTESLLKELASADLGAHRGDFLELDAHYHLFRDPDDQQSRERLERALFAPELSVAQRASVQGMLEKTFPEAIAAYQRAVDADPYAYEARTMLASLLMVSSRHQEAREQLDALRVLAPEDDTIPQGYALHFEMMGNRAAADAQLALLRPTLSDGDFALVQSMLRTLRTMLDAVRGAEGDSPTAQVTALLWQLPTAAKALLNFDRPTRQAMFRVGNHPAMRELYRRLTSNALAVVLPSAAEKLNREMAEIMPDGSLLLGAAALQLQEIDVNGLVKQGKAKEAQQRLHEVEAKIIHAAQQPSLDPNLPRLALFKLLDVRAILTTPSIPLPADPERREQLIHNLYDFLHRYPDLRDYEAPLLMSAARGTKQHDLGRMIATQWERNAANKVPPLESRMLLELQALDPWHARLAAEKILALKSDHAQAKEVMQLTAGALRQEVAKIVAQDAKPPAVDQEEGR